MFGLLYVHLRRTDFSLSLYLRSPPFTNFVTHPLCFLTRIQNLESIECASWDVGLKKPRPILLTKFLNSMIFKYLEFIEYLDDVF